MFGSRRVKILIMNNFYASLPCKSKLSGLASGFCQQIVSFSRRASSANRQLSPYRRFVDDMLTIDLISRGPSRTSKLTKQLTTGLSKQYRLHIQARRHSRYQQFVWEVDQSMHCALMIQCSTFWLRTCRFFVSACATC